MMFEDLMAVACGAALVNVCLKRTLAHVLPLSQYTYTYINAWTPRRVVHTHQRA